MMFIPFFMYARITAIADDRLRVGGVDNGIHAHIGNVVAYDLKGHKRHSFQGVSIISYFQ